MRFFFWGAVMVTEQQINLENTVNTEYLLLSSHFQSVQSQLNRSVCSNSGSK
jgi:hypothetical protein